MSRHRDSGAVGSVQTGGHPGKHPRGLAHPRSSASSVRSGVGAIVILGGTEYWLDIFPRHPTRLSNTGSGRGNAREDKRLSLRMLCCSLHRKMDRTTGPFFVHLSSHGDLRDHAWPASLTPQALKRWGLPADTRGRGRRRPGACPRPAPIAYVFTSQKVSDVAQCIAVCRSYIRTETFGDAGSLASPLLGKRHVESGANSLRTDQLQLSTTKSLTV